MVWQREASCSGGKCCTFHYSGPVSCSSLGRQRCLYLPCRQSFCVCVSLGYGQSRFVWWALCIYEPEQTFTGASDSSQGGGREGRGHHAQPWLPIMCHRLGIQNWHIAREKWPVGLEIPALPGSPPAVSSPHLPPMRSRQKSPGLSLWTFSHLRIHLSGHSCICRQCLNTSPPRSPPDSHAQCFPDISIRVSMKHLEHKSEAEL